MIRLAHPRRRKPPLGLKPRRLVIEHRVADIKAAIDRYQAAGVTIPSVWIVELSELEHWLKVHDRT